MNSQPITPYWHGHRHDPESCDGCKHLVADRLRRAQPIYDEESTEPLTDEQFADLRRSMFEPDSMTHVLFDEGEQRLARAIFRTLDAARPDARLADAILNWFDTTHGNYFGHDHHCPVRSSPEETFTQDPDDRCTCGWSDVLRADRERVEAATRKTGT